MSIYILDHDALKEGDMDDFNNALQASQPDFVCDDEKINTIISTIIDEYKEEWSEWNTAEVSQ